MKKLLIALALWLAPWPAQAADSDPCVYEVGDYPAAAQAHLDALRADAFADAYGTYIADLERVRADSQRWSSEMNEYARGRCRTYADALATYVQDVANWRGSSCVLGPMTEGMVAECDYRYSQLELRRRILEDRERENLAVLAELNRRAELLRATGEPAFRHASTVLDPAHVEDALRLYASWMERQGASDSCRSLARIAGKLGERVTDPWTYLELLARNLVTDPERLNLLITDASLRPFSFTSSGFQAQFADPSDRDQVRHALTYMVVGYWFTGTLADIAAVFRDEFEGQHEDYLLGVEAGRMGFQLHIGTYRTSDFGRAIEERLCG